MTAFSPVRFRRYAQDLQRAIFEMSEEYKSEMGSLTKLREALGLENIELRYGNGKQFVTMDDKTVELPADASVEDVAKALNVTPMPAVNMVNAPVQAPAVAPAVAQAPAIPSAKPAGKPIPSSGGYTPGSLKTLLQGLRDRQSSVMTDVEDKAKKAHKALDQAAKVGNDLDATADAILSELGQFSNYPDEE